MKTNEDIMNSVLCTSDPNISSNRTTVSSIQTNFLLMLNILFTKMKLKPILNVQIGIIIFLNNFTFYIDFRVSAINMQDRRLILISYGLFS